MNPDIISQTFPFLTPQTIPSHFTTQASNPALSKEEVREKIIREALVNLFEANPNLVAGLADLTIEQLSLVMFCEFFMRINENEIFKGIKYNFTELFILNFSTDSSSSNRYFDILEKIDIEVKNLKADDPEYTSRLLLIKRLHRALNTSMHTEKVSKFIKTHHDVNPRDGFIRVIKSVKAASEYSLVQFVNAGKKTLEELQDLINIVGDADKQIESYILKFKRFEKIAKKSTKSFRSIQESIQKLDATQDPLKQLCLMKLLFSEVQKNFALQKSKSTERNFKKEKDDILIQRNKLTELFKDQPDSNNINFLELFSVISPLESLKQKALNSFQGIYDLLDCADLIIQAFPLYKKFDEILQQYIQKMEIGCASLNQENDTDILTIFEEWNGSNISKKAFDSVRNSLPPPTKRNKKNAKNRKKTSPEVPVKNNRIPATAITKNVTRSSISKAAPALLNPAQIMNIHLEDLELDVRSQAVAGIKAEDKRISFFGPICLREAGYHLALLRNAFNAYLYCLNEGRSDLLNGFPLLFLKFQHLSEEQFYKYCSINELNAQGKSWDDLYTTHSLVNASGRSNEHLVSLNLGTLWARYPNHYEEYANPKKWRLKWLVDNPVSLNWDRPEQLKFDERHQKASVKSVVNTLQTFENRFSKSHVPPVEKVDIDDLIKIATSKNPIKIVMDKTLTGLKDIEDKLKQTLLYVRSNHPGLMLDEQRAADRACRDAIFHINHLAWSYALMKELRKPEFFGMHCHNFIWNMQFCLEQYFVALCVLEKHGIITDHDLAIYQQLLSNNNPAFPDYFVTDINIKMATSYPFFYNEITKDVTPIALELLIQSYKTSSEVQIAGESFSGQSRKPEEIHAQLMSLLERFMNDFGALTDAISKKFNTNLLTIRV